MRLLLYSGILYLTGVAIILALKPTLMFREDNAWKEFGIGRNPDKYTWFPFWLFAIVWAIVSYGIILILASIGLLPGIDLRPNGTFNNSRNLSQNLYEVKKEILPVVEAEDFYDNIEPNTDSFEEVNGEGEIDTNANQPYISELDSTQKLEELEVSPPKSNNRSTARGRRAVSNPAPKPLNLRKGYYILNTNSTQAGVPKYVYLGPEAPRVLYN